jgi:hypothetical protein
MSVGVVAALLVQSSIRHKNSLIRRRVARTIPDLERRERY